MKILLADSEPENIKNFRTYIKMNFNQIRTIGSMKAYADHIKEISDFAPDILICDLRFFGKAAYQQLLEIHERFPELAIILYGLYQDSEYMKMSLANGVIDFMYKPVKPPEFERCLHEAIRFVKELEEKRAKENSLVESYSEHMAMFENRFLLNVVSGGIKKNNEIKNSFHYFNVGLEAPYRILIIRIDHFQTLILALDEMEKHMLIHRMNEVVANYLSGKLKAKAFISNFNMATVILSGGMSLQDAIVLGNKLRGEIKNKLRLGVTIGVGNQWEHENEIACSYNEARGALRYRYLYGYDTVIPLQYVEPVNKVTYRYPQSSEDALVFAAVIGEYEQCLKLLKEILSSLRQAEPLPKGLIQKIVMTVIVSINRYMTEQNIVFTGEFNYYFPTKDVFALQTPDEAFSYLSKSLEAFCSLMYELRTKQNERAFGEAAAYIKENYSADLTLETVSMEASMPQELLASLFRKTLNKGFAEYLLEVRIEAAKTFLRGSGLDEEEVALKTGFEDIRYFRSIFKQHTGVNPSDFRAGLSNTVPLD